jgi:hypothetical protein
MDLSLFNPLAMAPGGVVGLIALGTASAIGAVLGLRQGLVRYRAAAVASSSCRL